jgi:hypothetical protein
MSSMRSNHLPPLARASRKLPTAATSEPKCSHPVGDGAKRPQQAAGRSPAAARLLVMAGCLSAPPCVRPTAPAQPSLRRALVFAAGPGRIFWSS